MVSETERAKSSSAIILNTYDELEQEALNAFKSLSLPPVYSIGPLQFQLNHQIPKNDPIMQIGSNLWKEKTECFHWLDTKEPNSVVYVNFGSITVMTPNQLDEFAWGLANSKKNFLWVIRPDLVSSNTAFLTPEFMRETKEQGLLTSWCPQKQVLNHPAVGGFLTHSGWNSTLESICAGVPMICWPFFAEQQTNCRYSCSEWGIGMEIDSNVKRDGVEALVRVLMEGEKGKEMKMKAMVLKKKSKAAATVPTGSSYVNLDLLIKQVLLSPIN